jgi:hypothetical protein
MSDNKSNGIGLGGVLAVLFVGLKLTGYIDWSWWWVTSPITIPFTLGIALILLGLTIERFQK